MSGQIEMMAYREAWVADFLALKAVLQPLFAAGAIIQHIGSTAVPGLAAKDIIDIQVSIDDLAGVDIAAIEQAGFLHRPGLRDHCPSGLSLDAQELEKLFFRSTGRAVHVHIREQGRFNQRYALLFRDYLRAYPVAAHSYGTIKQQLAARFADDVEAYYDIKDPVCDLIMEAAELWAKASGWVVPEGD